MTGCRNAKSLPLETLAVLKRELRARQDGLQHHVVDVAGVLVTADDPLATCPVSGRSLVVQKTVQRHGLTVSHGAFRVRETVRVCGAGCHHEGARVSHRPAALTGLIPPGRVVGYDVMVRVGVARFVQHQPREEIRAGLAQDHGLVLSSGAISARGHRFLVYLEALHRAQAPALAAALAADGGWPLHLDATGEDGRGTLLVVLSGWRGWVLGAWKVPTECSEVILPRLVETAASFGAPCAVMGDLGRAVTDAAAQCVDTLPAPIPVLACPQHSLRDVGTDLLRDGHDRLRGLFRHLGLRPQLRAFVRRLGQGRGPRIHEARVDLRTWLEPPAQDRALPDGAAGMVVVRALAQWTLDYAADGAHEGFPFDVPYLDFYIRCLHIRWAAAGFLRTAPPDPAVTHGLARLHTLLAPLACEVPSLGHVAQDLKARATLFAELRAALRLAPPSPGRQADVATPSDTPQTARAFDDIRAAVAALTVRLTARRSARGPRKDIRQGIDIVLTHLDRHGPYLWGHAITVDPATGRVPLVDRTNNILEGFFHRMKHGERRRSGRKILTQDFERLPAAAALAPNLTRPDYVKILCGSIEHLPRAFAHLDEGHRAHALPARTPAVLPPETETASMPRADTQLIRLPQMERRIVAAAR